MTLAFLDTNVPIYASGGPHELRAPCKQILVLVAHHPHSFVTSAEVLQELLHRYLALLLWAQGRPAFTEFAELMRDRVEPCTASDVEEAARLADRHPELSARDLLHAAVMHRLGVERVVSADTGFDRLPGLQRLDPARFEEWSPVMGSY